jgi:hypothetical protein
MFEELDLWIGELEQFFLKPLTLGTGSDNCSHSCGDPNCGSGGCATAACPDSIHSPCTTYRR